jgi:tetratricopeptide (TPR) repeat protein
LKGILQSRIDLLDQRQKLVLQCGAVLGQRFAVQLIELFEVIRDGLLSKLYSLKGLEFLEDVRTPQDLEFIFKHHLIREASYQSLLKKQRQGFHRLIGERMEEVFHSRLEELYPVLAWHFDQGDDRERAIHYLHLAGDRATAQAATTDALEFYEGALKRLMQGDSSEADRARASAILKSKGRLHRIAGQNALAFESFEMGRRLLERAADGDAMANLAVETGLTYIQTSEYAKARHELEVGFENGAGESLRAMASNGLGYCAWGEGDYKEARRRYLTALELAAASKNLGIEDDARNNLALLDWKEGKLADALENLRFSLRLSQKTGNRFGTALTLMNIGILEENMGRFRAARRHYGDALTLAEKIRYVQVQAATRSNLGNLCLVENRLAEAMEHNARSLDLAGQAGDARSEAIALENLALGHIGLTQYAEAGECLRSARNLAKKIGDSERLLSLDLVETEQLISELEGRSCAEPEGKNLAPEDGKPGAVVGPPSKAHWTEALERLASARAALEPRGLLGELPRVLRLRVRALRGAGNEAEAREALREGLAVCAEQQNHAEELRLRRLEATTT